ncbi:MAG TPA: hypothetical protein PLR74_08310, partial [Agriterribacter sp.]|nr:hypothetical protein [Agriterribacter sp.]
RDADRNALPFIAPFKSVNTVSVFWKGYSLSATSVYAAAQHHVSTEKYGELPSKAYTIANLSAGRSFLLEPVVLDCHVGVVNLFDNNYYEHLDVLKLPRQGRNIVMHLTVRF